MLDQLYLLVAAHTPQLRVAGMNGNSTGSLGLLHDTACLTGQAAARNRNAFHELNTVATRLQAHDINIRSLMLTNVVVVGYAGCHTAARFQIESTDHDTARRCQPTAPESFPLVPL